MFFQEYANGVNAASDLQLNHVRTGHQPEEER